ncbi:MAG: response regulator [Pseudomonadota bacterium]
MDEDEMLTMIQTPTAKRPLLGLTILVVEDSRYACETMRLMCLRSGARIRRADSLRSARRHLKVYRPSAVIVDLGLPDGSGLDLIKDMATASPRVNAIIGISGETNLENQALEAGADSFIAKPVASIAAFQHAILSVLPMQRPVGPRAVSNEEINPDQMAYRDDMNHAANLLDDHKDGPMLDYITQFVGGVARSAKDETLAAAARHLADARSRGQTPPDAVKALVELIHTRLDNKIAI